MKKLGLIGGIGPESTISYYHDVIYGVQQAAGEAIFPPIIIESLSVFEVLRFCEEKDYQGLTMYLLDGLHNLAAAGADFAAMTGNTPHIVFQELEGQSPIPLVSIVEVACTQSQKLRYHKIGLLGTGPTMRADFFKKPFLQHGIEVAIPSEKEMDYISGKIVSELELGVIKQETISTFCRIANRMISEEHIDAVVLGCTELPLLFQGVKLPVPYLDTMQVHIQTLIDGILEKTI